jgi:hypothetical protein
MNLQLYFNPYESRHKDATKKTLAIVLASQFMSDV